MFLCSDCDPCGGFFLNGGNCFGGESRGRCEGCHKHAICTDCHSREPIRSAGKHRKAAQSVVVESLGPDPQNATKEN